MKKFMVTVKEVYTREIEVEAESKEEAIEKANDVIEEGEDEINLEYSHTLDTDEWTAEEMEEGEDVCSKCRKCGENTCGNDSETYSCFEESE